MPDKIIQFDHYEGIADLRGKIYPYTAPNTPVNAAGHAATEFDDNTGTYQLTVSDVIVAGWYKLRLTSGGVLEAKYDVHLEEEAGTYLVHDRQHVIDNAKLSSDGVDAVLIESGISAGAGLTNDTGTQLTSINARQALSLALSALAGVVSGVIGFTPAFKPAAKPAGSTRIQATTGADGRPTVTVKVPD